jgi:hypothetical protein
MRLIVLLAAVTMGVGLADVSAAPINATVIDEVAAAVSPMTGARTVRRAGRVRHTNTTGANTNTTGSNTKTNR